MTLLPGDQTIYFWLNPFYLFLSFRSSCIKLENNFDEGKIQTLIKRVEVANANHLLLHCSLKFIKEIISDL